MGKRRQRSKVADRKNSWEEMENLIVSSLGIHML